MKHAVMIAPVLMGFLFLFAMPKNVIAQQCRSTLAGSLKPLPFYEPLSWAVELGANVALHAPDTLITDARLYLAVAWEFHKPFQLYLEGGLKACRVSGGDAVASDGSERCDRCPYGVCNLGIREGFLEYSGFINTVRLGLQTMRLPDPMLLDERVLGASWDVDLGPFLFALRGGTVSSFFSRSGRFCGTRCFFSEIMDDGRGASVTWHLLRANLIGGSIVWKPGEEMKKRPDASPSALASDSDFEAFEEFEQFDDGAAVGAGSDAESSRFNSLGAVVYSEFGDDLNTPQWFFGLFAEMELPGKIGFDTEIVFQQVPRNRMLLGYYQLRRDIPWSNGHLSSLKLGVVASIQLDRGSRFRSEFSNTFMSLGDYLRSYDRHYPLAWISFRQHFMTGWGQKIYDPFFKVTYLQQTAPPWMGEADFEVGVKLFKYLSVSLGAGVIHSRDLERNPEFVGILRTRLTY